MVTLCWCCESPNSLCSLFVLEVAQVFVALKQFFASPTTGRLTKQCLLRQQGDLQSTCLLRPQGDFCKVKANSLRLHLSDFKACFHVLEPATSMSTLFLGKCWPRAARKHAEARGHMPCTLEAPHFGEQRSARPCFCSFCSGFRGRRFDWLDFHSLVRG